MSNLFFAPAPNPSREQIISTLYTRLQAGLGSYYTTIQRRLLLWSDVPKENQPALFLVEHKEDFKKEGRGLPRAQLFKASIICYFDTSDPSIVGGTLINNALDQIEAVLLPPPGFDAQTLNGIVNRCWIEGEIFKVPGDIDGQAMLVVPVLILTP
jgi:hypothetical protein